jgi:hypothetical protein
MGKIYKTADFLKYINTPLNKSTILKIYEENNIKVEYLNLYYDFIISLTSLVFDTYLGDELTDRKHRVGHFKWCWDKVISNFKEEGINIGNNDDIYLYFLEFMTEVYYNYIDKDELQCNNIKKLWDYIFSRDISKSRTDIDTVLEIYKIFTLSLKKV